MSGRPWAVVYRSIYRGALTADLFAKYGSLERAEQIARELAGELGGPEAKPVRERTRAAVAWVEYDGTDPAERATLVRRYFVRGKPGDGWEREVPMLAWVAGTPRPDDPQQVFVGADDA